MQPRKFEQPDTMSRDPRFDVLFEPVQIGPVTAPNRFYQVPHCTGLGWLRPRMVAALRGMKAEGGWGVVCTEYCSIHPASDDLPHPYASLWDQGDIRAHALMTEQVHEHGSLAGAELWIGGSRSNNLFTQEVSMDVSSMPNAEGFPYQSRAMDKSDIRELRRWHRNAALRARDAGFDIVYVYATHHYLLQHFLSAKTNTRSDEYGGSLENRARLIRELIEETKDAVGDRCAVAVRFCADEGGENDGDPIFGDQREILEMLAELPDLWDINISDYSREMGASRFIREGSLEAYMSWVKSVTSKPVVTVGRFTSPDTMLSQVNRGIVDFIGAARPSIADPFLPRKIEEGRIDEIRECIGCNICYTGDSLSTPIRCTQNPTISEEWRRGWHPEKIEAKSSDSTILVVGAGPAGLEASRALARRGYPVMLAEAEESLGGRVTRESALPGLGEWARVRNYRTQEILTSSQIDVFLRNRMSAEDVLAVEADHVVIATGARWRADGTGLYTYQPLPLGPPETVFTPDDIMDGRLPEGRVVIYDDNHYYMSSVIAELLRNRDQPVTLITPENVVSTWGGMTGERSRLQRRLMQFGVEIVTQQALARFDGETVETYCTFTEQIRQWPASALVTVTTRTPNDGLYRELEAQLASTSGYRPKSLTRIGDCEAPGIIANAVFAGHRYARELEADVDPDNPMKYDRVFFDDE